MDRLNYIDSGNAAYINTLYEAYTQDPASVDFGWQKFFEGFDFGKDTPAASVSTIPAEASD
ncbi:MAG: 2-oxoglutarate dehydrogenase E1 subunit family protein, partial [Mucilaginibacter sp.]